MGVTTATATKPKKGLRGAQLRDKIRSNPEWFMRRCLGSDPWEKQVEIAEAMFRSQRVAVRGCVASSKTNAISMAAFAWLYAWPDARVFTFAPSYRQVGTNLWAELKARYAQAEANGVPLGGKLFAGTEFKRSDNCYMKGFSTKEPAMLHGIHGPHDLIILDDAHGIPRELTDELENMMAGGQTHIIMSFNPVSLQGETYDCTHSMKDLWENIKISFWDTPNAKAKFVDGVLKTGRWIAGMLLPETVKVWARKYGINSNFYKSKVDAEYPTQEPDTLIPMDWIEQAMAREVVVTAADRLALGVDVARQGDDMTCFAPLRGRQMEALKEWSEPDTMKTADRVDAELLSNPGSAAFIDENGLGAGVVDRELQRKREIYGIMVSEKAYGTIDGKPAEDRFDTLRSQIMWLLRESLDPNNKEAISLPKDMDLAAQLSNIKWGVNEKTGKIEVEQKKMMKKRLGFSPDRLDAAANAVFGQWLFRGATAVNDWVKRMAEGTINDAVPDGVPVPSNSWKPKAVESAQVHRQTLADAVEDDGLGGDGGEGSETMKGLGEIGG